MVKKIVKTKKRQRQKGGSDELMKAIDNGDIDTFKRLIDSGINPNFKDKWKFTVLMNASHKLNTEMVEILCKKGARINETSNSGFTVFFYALKAIADLNTVDRSSFKLLDILIDYGVDINLKDLSGKNALSYVVETLRENKEENFIKILEYMNERGADLDGLMIIAAADKYNFKIVDKLLDYDIKLDLPADLIYRFFDRCLFHKQYEIIKKALSKPSLPNEAKMKFFHRLCVHKQDIDIIQKTFGSKFIQEKDGLPIIIELLIVTSGYKNPPNDIIEIVDLLLKDKKPDLSIRYPLGTFFVYMMKYVNNIPICRLLLDNLDFSLVADLVEGFNQTNNYFIISEVLSRFDRIPVFDISKFGFEAQMILCKKMLVTGCKMYPPVDNGVPAYMILAHGADLLDEEELVVPEGCIYVTLELCGNYSVDWDLIVNAFEDPNVHQYLRDPICYYENLKEIFGTEISVKPHGLDSGGNPYTYANSKYNFMLGWDEDKVYWGSDKIHAYKSGFYQLGEPTGKILHNGAPSYNVTDIFRMTALKTDPNMVAELYAGSIYPLKSDITEYLSDKPFEYREVLGHFKKTQRELFEMRKGIHYNFVCRVFKGENEPRKVALRRATSIRMGTPTHLCPKKPVAVGGTRKISAIASQPKHHR